LHPIIQATGLLRRHKYEIPVLDLRTKEEGKSIALNYGVEHSTGKYILVLDADHELNKDFIEKALPGSEEPYAAVQGRVYPINSNYNFVTKMTW
jgi:cellulose synthase/poly-beta-1,6-N-acetylglucosamine synthase-like glycosyltransferase